MRNVPIKFRGVDIETGKIVFGVGVKAYNKRADIVPKSLVPVEVQAESVAQLVGYDVDGNEVYEGDTLTDSEGHKYTASLESRVEWEGTHTVSKHWTLPFERVEDLEVNRAMPLEFWKRFELKTKSWLTKEVSEDEECTN